MIYTLVNTDQYEADRKIHMYYSTGNSSLCISMSWCSCVCWLVQKYFYSFLYGMLGHLRCLPGFLATKPAGHWTDPWWIAYTRKPADRNQPITRWMDLTHCFVYWLTINGNREKNEAMIRICTSENRKRFNFETKLIAWRSRPFDSYLSGGYFRVNIEKKCSLLCFSVFITMLS